MKPAERGTLNKEGNEREGRALRDFYLYRAIERFRGELASRAGRFFVSDVPSYRFPFLAADDAEGQARVRATFALCAALHLSIGDSHRIWEAFDLDNECGAANAASVILQPPPIRLWKYGEPGNEQINLTVPPGARVPPHLDTIINQFRASEDDCWVHDGRDEPSRVHTLWLRHGPGRARVAEAWEDECGLQRDEGTVNTYLQRHRRAWMRALGGRESPLLWRVINQFPVALLPPG